MQKLNRTEMAIPMRSRAGHSPLPLPPVPQPLKGFQPMSDAPPPIPPEQQEARLQGVMTISHYLESLGEPGWRGVLLQWLGRYDGIEVYMFPEEDPVLAVQELLGAYVEQGKSLDPEEFAAELADLHFCHYRARRDSDRKKWEPLAETFAAFCEGVLVTVWQGAEPYPSRDLIQSSLLVRFCRAQLDSRRP